MTDTQGTGCGIYPFIFKSWMTPACEWHDGAYTEGSWHQHHMTRLQVDDHFFEMLMLMADGDCVKEVEALAAYKVVRALGWIWWEGELDKEDGRQFCFGWDDCVGAGGARLVRVIDLRAAMKEATLHAKINERDESGY